jgi:hypothetical protein
MAWPDDVVRSLGGVAARRELLAAGLDVEWIEIWRKAGRIERVRNGWYCLPETHPDIKRAWRVGGRLACVSAAAFRGSVTLLNQDLHVSVSRNSAKLRHPDLPGRLLVDAALPNLVLHWVEAVPFQKLSPGERSLVGPDGAARQMRSCPGSQIREFSPALGRVPKGQGNR